MKSNRREQLISMFVISLALFASNIQASSVVDGPLGIWITQQASPKLGEILTQHPRFKGERIKVMAMRDGHPMAVVFIYPRVFNAAAIDCAACSATN